MNQHTAIGIDLAKQAFQVCIVNTRQQRVRTNKVLKRAELLDYLRRQPSCRVFMEACGGSHHWSRQFQAMGHEVRLIAPQFVTPFRKGHKTDANDALAIVEAGLRPHMRFVPQKNLEQQDLQSLHRIRDRYIKQRTQLINQVHGLLQEYGIVSGRGQAALKRTLWRVLEDAENELTFTIRELLADQMAELDHQNERIHRLDKQMEQLSRAIPACQRLQAVEGVGPVVATQLYSALGNGKAFSKGRQASAYLGLTPRQFSSGGKVAMTGIGRTGQLSLKAALIRGAHSVIQRLGDKQDSKSHWLRALVDRVGKNKAAVALANKTVRVAWALLHGNTTYRADYVDTEFQC
ncbi:IS110 family transposase [Halomonas piscis]|uniref:IS110 family transposase n=3 Tax=Halomonas piscis TaxID=3031727 RepID=A0ABY9YZD7_9GAMM|nr:IS110 family transposase [Halomonas piscis]WNK19015.1 IS110 family transposase [Halomonas piscis]WNK19820.1 IS110 family transposase [Halomonas piscis]WNK20619.1 IS110 family transposase [Halomonas piscis]WNK21021.1 IS110 family transposase [Halomonas piscis]